MIIHTSPLPDVDIPDVTITTHVLRRADELADRLAITDASGASAYTYRELKQAIAQLAGGLAARGIGPGQVVGLMAPNLPEYAVVFHAVAVAGAAVTTSVVPASSGKRVSCRKVNPRSGHWSSDARKRFTDSAASSCE